MRYKDTVWSPNFRSIIASICHEMRYLGVYNDFLAENKLYVSIIKDALKNAKIITTTHTKD